MSLRRVYETTIIINAALEDPDVDAVISKIISYLENNGSVIEEQDKWGRRRLAYPINKKQNGFYMHIVFNAEPNVIPAFERFLTLDDTIIRHLTLQLSNELREYRKERSLASGKSGETLITSVAGDIASTRVNARVNTRGTGFSHSSGPIEFKEEVPVVDEVVVDEVENANIVEISEAEVEVTE